MLGLLLVAGSLGLSNFAAAIGIGVPGIDGRTRWRVGAVLGFFEAAMPVTGLALSIDNLAAGFALGTYHVSLAVAVAAAVIGGVSVALSLAGLELGARIGTRTGRYGEFIGGGVLILVGAALGAGLI